MQENEFDRADNKVTLDAQFERERMKWEGIVREMSLQMKRIASVGELMTTIYTDRQQAVEYYHYLLSVLIQLNAKYRKEYAEKYDFWTTKSQIRYPNETTKVNKILSEMSDISQKKEKVENHANFMKNTLATIDNIIYAIPRRIDVEKMINGDKT